MASNRRPGRPTKFNARVAERLVWAISQGYDDYMAAKAVGIGRATLYRWLSDTRPEYRGFQARVAQAEAAAEAAVTANIVEGSKTDWRAGLAWLRARHPERWAVKRAPTPRFRDTRR